MMFKGFEMYCFQKQMVLMHKRNYKTYMLISYCNHETSGAACILYEIT